MAETEAAQSSSYFLSYSRSDQAFALKFAKDIRAQGVSMWVDQLDIRPSEHWDRAIERAVRECRGIVVILSPRSVASDNVADEISYAIDSGKSVLPVMIERCTLPLRITRMQVVDATGNYQQALQRCLTELCRGVDQVDVRGEIHSAPSEPLDPAILQDARARLTRFLGPIASLLVDKAAQRASSAEELNQMLAQHIREGPARESFLERNAPKPVIAAKPEPKTVAKTTEIPAGEVDALAKVLLRYMGPIASAVVKRESAACHSSAELTERLASLIPREEERAQFLREARSK